MKRLGGSTCKVALSGVGCRFGPGGGSDGALRLATTEYPEVWAMARLYCATTSAGRGDSAPTAAKNPTNANNELDKMAITHLPLETGLRAFALPCTGFNDGAWLRESATTGPSSCRLLHDDRA
ncbi:MAG: hypothetical protein SGI86_05375 [Deltaproteobacteria bacterium]|nr:hypothetical protein [Deltaproteobacteria bacterium]